MITAIIRAAIRNRFLVLIAALLLAAGLLLRVVAGLTMAPRRGVRTNVLLGSSWLRLRDLAGLAPVGAGDRAG